MQSTVRTLLGRSQIIIEFKTKNAFIPVKKMASHQFTPPTANQQRHSQTNCRVTHFCGISECPPGQVYHPCASTCHATCYDPYPPCGEPCFEGCACPKGTLWHNGECISQDSCFSDGKSQEITKLQPENNRILLSLFFTNFQVSRVL